LIKKEEMRESPGGRSQISLYQQCPRKWAFKYVKGWKVPQENFSALHFGSTIHEMQAILYDSKSLVDVYDYIESSAPLTKSSTDLVKEFRKKVDLAFRMWYTELGQNDLENMEILEVEKELVLTLPNGFKMTVRLDRLLRDPETGEIFINDTKTTGWSYEGTMEKYLRSDQAKLYILAVRENFPQYIEDLSGWRTDVVYIRKAPRSPDGYSRKCGRSVITSFSEQELTDVLQTYAGVTDIIASSLVYKTQEPLSSLFPGNYERCYDFNRLCEYSAVCPYIDTQEEHPADLMLDPWLAKKTVLNLYEELQ